MNPNFLNLFMKKLTRDRVVPTIKKAVTQLTWLSFDCLVELIDFIQNRFKRHGYTALWRKTLR